MAFYKLISGTNIVGIATQHDLRMFQQKHQILLACDVEDAQYIEKNDTFYRADWMVPVVTDKIEYEIAEVVVIDEEEYNILSAAIETGEKVVVEEEASVEEEIETVDEDVEPTLEYVRSSKVLEMSRICKKTIEDGFDIELSDGKAHHFSLSTQDQLNIASLSSMISGGEEAIPYHADGELCKFYSVDDANAIISGANDHKTYHISYFNTLKSYIDTMNDIKQISKVTYGMKIPKKYQSEVLKYLISQETK